MYGPHGLPMHSLGLFGFDTHDCSLSNQDSCLPPVATDTTLSLQCPPYRPFLLLFTVAEWLARWTQAQKDLGSNRSRDAVG